MKHRIGIVGTLVVGASFLFACANSAPEADIDTSDLSTHVAALSVNGDGSDEAISSEPSEEASPEPIMARGCGFSEIAQNVVARFDADQSGDLDATEKAELVAEYGDAASGVAGRHPNRGQPTRAAVLLQAYDSDGSGSLEASEIASLQADIQARCEERRAKLVEEFDANGDGSLDESEWEAARAALRERIAERRRARISEFDADADGHLDAEERAALRDTVSERRASVEAEFDIDGDGELDTEERAALEEYLRACVKTDLPMDSREGAIEHRGHGRPDAVGDENPESDESSESDSDDDVSSEGDESASDDSSDSDSSSDDSSDTASAADETDTSEG